MKKYSALLTLSAAFLFSPLALAAISSNSDLVSRGEYLARAGDCTACHTAAGGAEYAGGYKFNMPMGTIVAPNITSSVQYGIGNWSEADFAKAVRQGVRPDGSHLYPAMPYTSYATVTDEDMQALYAFFKTVPAVDKAPADKNDLKFPFNLPGLMGIWNALFASDAPFKADPALTAEQNRGKYLAEGLAHCSTCHSPRNQMMAEDTHQLLAGNHVDGWLAPNITSDAVSGIGGWSQQELTEYLKTGHVEGKAQAGGPMADAIEHSFSHLSDSDLASIAAWLKTVPAIRTPGQTQPSWAAAPASKVDWTSYQTGGGKNNSPAYRDSSTTDGAVLFDSSCAACHQSSGQGSDDHYFPSLTHNSAVGAADPSNLVMAIVDGIHRKTPEGEAVMPAFSSETQAIHSWLNNDQIAAVTNYVTEKFGHGNAGLTGADVEKIRNGNSNVPFLIKNAGGLTIGGIVIVVIIIIALLAARSRKKRR